MGWSCRKSAGDVDALFTEACVAMSGMSNVFQDPVSRIWYMLETSRKEHDDGAITGTTLKFVDGDPRGKSSNRAVKSGSWRINGNGTIARAPKVLKDYVWRIRTHKDCGGAVRYTLGANRKGEMDACFSCEKCKATSLDDGTANGGKLDVRYGTEIRTPLAPVQP